MTETRRAYSMDKHINMMCKSILTGMCLTYCHKRSVTYTEFHFPFCVQYFNQIRCLSRTRFTRHIEPVAKVILNLSSQEQS